jgi:3-oxoadipate enol-lactonase
MSVRLHRQVSGPVGSPALLLGNPLGTDLRMWDWVVERLGDAFRIVRFDHRGQGASPDPAGPYTIDELGRDVVALLDELQIETATFCGVSLGGMVGLWLAIHAPRRVERLVACCTSAYPEQTDTWVQRANIVSAAASTEPIADQVVARWVTVPFALAHPEISRALREMLLASPSKGYAACCGVLGRLDLRNDLPRIRADTLVIAGAQDVALPPAHSAQIAGAIAGARLAVIDGVAHVPMVERPDVIADCILDTEYLP